MWRHQCRVSGSQSLLVALRSVFIFANLVAIQCSCCLDGETRPLAMISKIRVCDGTTACKRSSVDVIKSVASLALSAWF